MPVTTDQRKARLILDMLSKPVDADEDEFLDTLDVNKSFHCAPSKPQQDLDSLIKAEEEGRKVLDSLADVNVVVEEDVEYSDNTPLMRAAGPGEFTKNEQFLFSLYQGHAKKDAVQASVPRDLDLKMVGASERPMALPRVALTEREKEILAEDEARRAANVKAGARNEQKKSEMYEKTHAKFLTIFDDIMEKK